MCGDEGPATDHPCGPGQPLCAYWQELMMVLPTGPVRSYAS